MQSKWLYLGVDCGSRRVRVTTTRRETASQLPQLPMPRPRGSARHPISIGRKIIHQDPEYQQGMGSRTAADEEDLAICLDDENLPTQALPSRLYQGVYILPPRTTCVRSPLTQPSPANLSVRGRCLLSSSISFTSCSYTMKIFPLTTGLLVSSGIAQTVNRTLTNGWGSTPAQRHYISSAQAPALE